MSRPISITEFDTLREEHKALIDLLEQKQGVWRGVQLTSLQETTQTALDICEPFKRNDSGQWQADRWVGSLGLGNEQWIVEPRIGQPRFNLLTRHVLTAAIVRGGKRNISATVNGLDLLPLAWYVAFQNAVIRSGLPKAYVRRSASDCNELRGTLDLEQQLAHNMFERQHLACQWDEITHDNPINQTSRLATSHLRKHNRFPYVGNRSDPARQNLTRWDEVMALIGVKVPNATAVSNAVRWSRSNDGFRVPHQLAEWIVKNRGESSGNSKAPAILIDSAEVWELYLRERMRVVIQANPDLGVTLSWPRSAEKDYLLRWAGRSVRGLIPDFTFSRQLDQVERVVAVLDAKYRWYKSPADDTAIAEQMAFYAVTANQQSGGTETEDRQLPTLALIYPKAPNMNTHIKSGLIDTGYYLIEGHPKMCAWAIELPDPSNSVNFHEAVDIQVLQMISHVLNIDS